MSTIDEKLEPVGPSHGTNARQTLQQLIDRWGPHGVVDDDGTHRAFDEELALKSPPQFVRLYPMNKLELWHRVGAPMGKRTVYELERGE